MGTDTQVTISGTDGAPLILRPRMEGAGVEDFSTADFERILVARTDLLADELLAQGEVDLLRVAAALPRMVGYAFVGHPGVDERAIIAPDGSIEGVLGPLVELSPAELARRGRWGIIDPRLPLPVLCIEDTRGAVHEQIAVATIGAAGELRVLVRRAERWNGAERAEYLAPGSERPTGAAEFEAAVADAWCWAEQGRQCGLQLTGGDSELTDLALSSLHLADLTLRGCHPRYGIGVYDQERHHGFPPTTLFMALALLEWGRFARAGDVLNCYLDAYVRADGTFAYYGPAVAEYGQLLALAARYVDLTGDLHWWRTRQSVLRRVWQRLLGLRRASLADAEAPELARGLIPGLPEADYHHQDEQWREYYYAGDAWVVRGLAEIARVLRRSGQQEEAAALEADVADYRRDLLGSVAAASVAVGDEVYVPPGPAQREPIAPMTQSRHASYCNYRYFAEMLSAGVLDAATAGRVLAWRRAHGGELLAMTRFEGHLDDWPVAHWARALLETGEIARYQLLLYAHLAHHQCVGWLTAPEQASIVPDESGARYVVAGQVVPCQVTAALLLRWALACELRDEQTLLLAPAVLHRWTAGEGLSARDLPTRWGPVSLALRAEDGTLTARVELPEATPAQVRLRIPRPPGASVGLVAVEGAHAHAWDGEAGTVTLSGAGAMMVVARTAPTP